MKNIYKLIALVFTLFLFNASIFSQDSLAIFPWKVTSKKISDANYELVFSTEPVGDWKLYAPKQVADFQSTELKFADSSISQEGKFVENVPAKMVSNTLFGAANIYESATQWTMKVSFKDKESVPAKLQGELLYTYGKEPDVFYPAVSFPFTVALEGGVESKWQPRILSIDINNPVADCGDSISQGSSYFTIFLLGFLGGIIALFTPCVFPMIPLTVSFFTNKPGEKQKGAGNAILYGFFIFLIYILITVPFHIAGNTNPAIFNNISTNVWLNLIFFVIFVVFALSFFGLFEITLPSGLANKAGSKSGIGKIGGIFFMALTLAIVSFSCTGPILGTLLAGVADGGAWPLTAGAAGFGIALGLPFAIFALFPKWLQAIPKSGGWMTDIKVVLGFVEVALALKFLANADNVMQWNLFKREILIGLWVLIGLATVLYLLGVIRISHSTKPKRFGVPRVFFIILFAAVTIYLIPGLTNTKWAKLGLISGFPPPLCYSVYENPVNCDKPLLDYEQALQLAKEKNKPVLIDFTGWACVNCRRMEENVWTDSQVEKLMKEEFILVSLYVDEKTKLPTNQRVIYTSKNGDEKSIVSVGDKWTAFQLENFNATSQPQYAIISTDQKAMVKTKFYTPDAAEFAQWLKCGLDAFRKQSAVSSSSRQSAASSSQSSVGSQQ
jgi:thiol:disulfide interchange protein DsbD